MLEVLKMTGGRPRTPRPLAAWSTWVVAALLLLPLIGGWGWLYLSVVALSALLLTLAPGALPPRRARDSEPVDLVVILGLYLVVVLLMRLAFVGFGTDHVPGLFLSFAAALVLGVAGPVIYTVWTRQRSLRDLGLRRDNLRPTVLLAVLFAGVQFALTLWGYALPAAADWVPLLVMALVVGVFESIFFRGFIQNRLEAQFGGPVGIGGAAVLYGLYHVGYGMGAGEIAFLTGLGVTYAVAFALARNILVLWPLLTPLGSFYAQVEASDIDLPWASIAGFADVLAVMLAVIWIAHRHERRLADLRAPSPAPVEPHATRTSIPG